MELVGPPELLLPLRQCWAPSDLQALSSVALTKRSQELELILRLWMEQDRAQCALVASAMSKAQG